jgi:hypothetical protein
MYEAQRDIINTGWNRPFLCSNASGIGRTSPSDASEVGSLTYVHSRWGGNATSTDQTETCRGCFGRDVVVCEKAVNSSRRT